MFHLPWARTNFRYQLRLFIFRSLRQSFNFKSSLYIYSERALGSRLNVRFFPDSITMSDSKAHKTSAFDSERVCCFWKARKNWIFMKQLVFSPNNSTSHPTLQLTQQWFLSFCRNSCSQIFSNLNNISKASHQCRSTWPFLSIVSLTSRLKCLLQFKANRFYFRRLENSWTTFNAKHVCRYWDLILSWKLRRISHNYHQWSLICSPRLSTVL